MHFEEILRRTARPEHLLPDFRINFGNSFCLKNLDSIFLRSCPAQRKIMSLIEFSRIFKTEMVYHVREVFEYL